MPSAFPINSLLVLRRPTSLLVLWSGHLNHEFSRCFVEGPPGLGPRQKRKIVPKPSCFFQRKSRGQPFRTRGAKVTLTISAACAQFVKGILPAESIDHRRPPTLDRENLNPYSRELFGKNVKRNHPSITPIRKSLVIMKTSKTLLSLARLSRAKGATSAG